MRISTALHTGFRLPDRYPVAVLPFYLLTAGAGVVARVPLFVGVAVVLAVLSSSGRLDTFAERIQQVDFSALNAAEPTEPTGLAEALAVVVTPLTVTVFALAVLASVAVSLLVTAAVRAGTLSAVLAAIDGGDPTLEGVRGASRLWLSFVGFSLLRVVLFGGLLSVTVALAAVLLTLGPAGALAAALVSLVGVALALVVGLLLAFTEQSLVVDDDGLAGALGASARFPVRRPVDFLFYVLVAAAALVGNSVVVGTAGFLGATQAGALLSILLVSPIFDGFKTSLYAERGIGERDGAGSGDRPTRRRRVAASTRDGVGALGRFVVDHPGWNLVSTLVLAGSILAGYAATSGYGVRIGASGDVAGVFGVFPVGTFVNIAANNWLVAAGSAYGGLALGVPAAVSLAFNGVLIGALAGIFELVPFLALVAPHGVVELPGLVVAGALGLHLGVVGWRAYRGRDGAATVAEALRYAFRVLVGLAVVFVVASFVEAFLTPRIAAFVLGG
ncbi:stage II sporulation protein M [Haloprofundus sp. MHR1]|uniref:stage II sporulation protein M n=1 Tax=Haloprofundus sp. MHR1 TaxID=2572921 RepID=UPI0010BF2D5B|nr:stage II sporulation protein M [Haloprofundus sp. MHR1]QCJ46842.1 stage II sporulation protein M [Haloprofundus sp. MHR1]